MAKWKDVGERVVLLWASGALRCAVLHLMSTEAAVLKGLELASSQAKS